MSACTDEDLGTMLHDYELGVLSDDDTRRFEVHLIQCEYCVTQAREFSDVSRLFIHDPDVRELIDSLAGEGEQDVVHKGRTGLPFTRLLIAAVIVLALAAPVYRYWPWRGKAATVQTLKLLPMRASGSDVVYRDRGGKVEITFYAAEDLRASADVVIARFGGDTLLVKPHFSDFNEQGLGVLTLPVSDLAEGHYLLIIGPAVRSTTANEAQYMFRVK